MYHLDSRTYERLTDFGTIPFWLSDSRRLVFPFGEKVFLVDGQTRKLYEILSVPGETLAGTILSRDNRWLYFLRRKTSPTSGWPRSPRRRRVRRSETRA